MWYSCKCLHRRRHVSGSVALVPTGQHPVRASFRSRRPGNFLRLHKPLKPFFPKGRSLRSWNTWYRSQFPRLMWMEDVSNVPTHNGRWRRWEWPMRCRQRPSCCFQVYRRFDWLMGTFSAHACRLSSAAFMHLFVFFFREKSFYWACCHFKPLTRPR